MLSINLEKIDPIFMVSMENLRDEHIKNGFDFYVVECVDDLGNTLLVNASSYCRLIMNHDYQLNPNNRQPIVAVNCYVYHPINKCFMYFCDKGKLKNQPYFSAMIGSQDMALSIEERLECLKVAANCLHYGIGGAPLDQRTARVYKRELNKFFCSFSKG